MSGAAAACRRRVWRVAARRGAGMRVAGGGGCVAGGGWWCGGRAHTTAPRISGSEPPKPASSHELGSLPLSTHDACGVLGREGCKEVGQRHQEQAAGV